MSKNISTGYISATINGIAVKSNIKSHPGNYENDTKRDVSYIVMHYTGNDDDNAENNAKYFKNNDVDVSAHFFVDETRIHQSVELRDVAWHCGTDGKYYHSKCRNDNSFGIEMTTAGDYEISAKTIENSAYLCAYLCEMLGIESDKVDTYVLRHYDVTHKKCPAQFVDNADEWKAFKTKVKSILKSKEKTESKPAATTTAKKELYRVRKSWKDAASQTGAFSNLDNAIAQAKKDKLNVYDSSGKAVYTYKAIAKAVTKGCKVKVKRGAKDYNGDSVASFVYDKVYKVDELNGKRAVLDTKGICTAFHIDNLIVQ
jgi:N-acetylmuramoyl-L-alanine amidase CwlA